MSLLSSQSLTIISHFPDGTSFCRDLDWKSEHSLKEEDSERPGGCSTKARGCRRRQGLLSETQEGCEGQISLLLSQASFL